MAFDPKEGDAKKGESLTVKTTKGINNSRMSLGRFTRAQGIEDIPTVTADQNRRERTGLREIDKFRQADAHGVKLSNVVSAEAKRGTKINDTIAIENRGGGTAGTRVRGGRAISVTNQGIRGKRTESKIMLIRRGRRGFAAREDKNSVKKDTGRLNQTITKPLGIFQQTAGLGRKTVLPNSEVEDKGGSNKRARNRNQKG